MDMNLAYKLFDPSKPVSSPYKACQSLTYVLVGQLVKLVLRRHRLAIINQGQFERLYADRTKGAPLITVSNHHSCLDDFLLFGSLLSPRQQAQVDRYRWTLTASDICFTNRRDTAFFALGKAVPVWRRIRDRQSNEIIQQGGGIFQPSIDFCLDKLDRGEWIHVFPQGRVIFPFEYHRESLMRLRWGVGRLIAESKVPPIVLPIWHCGFNALSHPANSTARETIRRSFFTTDRHNLVIFVGQPINCSSSSLLSSIPRSTNLESRDRLKPLYAHLTSIVQSHLYSVKALAEQAFIELESQNLKSPIPSSLGEL